MKKKVVNLLMIFFKERNIKWKYWDIIDLELHENETSLIATISGFIFSIYGIFFYTDQQVLYTLLACINVYYFFKLLES